MAIAKIKKLELISLQEDKDKILAFLQKLGNVELIDIHEESSVKSSPIGDSINLLEIEEAVTYLASFQEKAAGFLKGMMNPRPVIYAQQLKEVIANFNYQAILENLSALRNHLKHLQQHRERLIQEQHLLASWQKLKIPLDQMQGTAACGILLGVLASRDYVNLLDGCPKENIDLFCECLSQDKTNAYLVILYFKEEFERLGAVLKNYHFNFVTLSRHKGTVTDRLLEINREAMILEDQMEDAKKEIAELSRERFKLMVVYDYIANANKIRQAEQHLARQKFTFNLSGWVKDKDTRFLEQEIARNFKDAAIFISQPRDDENIPVVLDNKRLIQPFEFITQIYGMPKYGELDPTPFLAPFFFLYVGLCVSDVGYGLLMVLVCGLALKKFQLGAQARKFFRLFLYCGISTIIAGVLTGSWFGNLLDIASEAHPLFLPAKRFKDFLTLLDPIKEPTKLLGIALSLGIVQIWFGNIVAAIGNIKNKRYLNVLLDQATMLILLFGLTGLGLIFLKLWGPRNIVLFKSATLIGAVGIVATQGRSEKGLGFKLFYGIFTLYNALSGYLSDILSYSRLWALGLVTGVMASTINLISVQFSQIFLSLVPFINRIGFIRILVSSIIFIIIFIFGHAVSFSMNLLGAFIHPLRLQFVEFFSKFFKGGGSALRPFKEAPKYIRLG